MRRIVDIQVFNRWGSLVYERRDFLPNDYPGGWDGRIADGELAPQGVYVWVMDVLFRDGAREQRSGSVTLIR